MINRRGLITGLISLAAAPAIVRASSVMLVKIIKPCLTLEEIAQIILNANNKLINDMIEHTVMFGTSIGEITYDKNIADSVIFTPVHNYLKLDQSISAKNVDPIKIINANDYEVWKAER